MDLLQHLPVLKFIQQLTNNECWPMLKTFSSICLLSLILISLYSGVFILQQQQYAAAITLSQNAHITLVNANATDLLANNKKNSPMDKTAQNSSTISQKQVALNYFKFQQILYS
jgi:hypothetical protein